MTSKATPRIVIVGAGFGGLNAAQTLAKAPVKITIIDRKNFHTFQPLLYQVATAGLSPGEIAAPIRSILRSHKNIEVLMTEVTGFDLDRRIVETSDTTVPYDYLIVAAGAAHSYFGHDNWEPYAPGLKTIEDALEIRRRVLLAKALGQRSHQVSVRSRRLDLDDLVRFLRQTRGIVPEQGDPRQRPVRVRNIGTQTHRIAPLGFSPVRVAQLVDCQTLLVMRY